MATYQVTSLVHVVMLLEAIAEDVNHRHFVVWTPELFMLKAVYRDPNYVSLLVNTFQMASLEFLQTPTQSKFHPRMAALDKANSK